MKSEQINLHFQLLKQQREDFYNDMGIPAVDAWRKPKHNPEKWSVGETLYHLFLLARLLRRFTLFYIPVMLPIAHLRKHKPYKIETFDIYKAHTKEKQKPMPAPLLLIPPADLERKRTIQEIKDLLEGETNSLMKKLDSIEEDVAGQIYFPDPIAHYPNLIQSVHLLAIHEQHHFDIVKKYVYGSIS